MEKPSDNEEFISQVTSDSELKQDLLNRLAEALACEATDETLVLELMGALGLPYSKNPIQNSDLVLTLLLKTGNQPKGPSEL